MIVLGLDTAAGACSAAVLDGERLLAQRCETMVRGHQERLAPLVQETMAQAGLPFAALDRIAVTVGPGSFTGVRVGLAFAKGLALALDRPCIGVGTLDALAASAGPDGLVAAVIDAKRGQVYLQVFADGVALMAPDSLDIAVAAARLVELRQGRACRLVGTGAALLGGDAAGLEVPDPAVVARLGAWAALTPPRPLYLRAPDAKLPGGRDLPA